MIKIRKEVVIGFFMAITLFMLQLWAFMLPEKCECLNYKEVKSTTIDNTGAIKNSKDSICVAWSENGSITVLNLYKND